MLHFLWTNINQSMNYIKTSIAVINYRRNYFANVLGQLMFLASRYTMIKQFTFHPIDVTAILFIFLEAVHNFKFHAIEPYRWALRCYLNSGWTGNSNKNHSPQQSIRYKYFCETVLLSVIASHLWVKLSRIASRCVKSDCLRVFV